MQKTNLILLITRALWRHALAGSEALARNRSGTVRAVVTALYVFEHIFPLDHHLIIGAGFKVVLQTDALGEDVRRIAVGDRFHPRSIYVCEGMGHYGLCAFRCFARICQEQSRYGQQQLLSTVKGRRLAP